jgi:hypothetical protein
MCGIIAVISNDMAKTVETVQSAYAKQYTRGSDGFGFVSVDTYGKLHAHKRCQTIKTAHKLLRKHGNTCVVFHHRFPTSTPNIAESNHPIKVSHDTFTHDYYVVHNGIISNARDRHAEHTKMGYTYTTTVETGYKSHSGKWYVDGDTSYNDSESLAWDLAGYLEGKASAVLSHGPASYVVLQVDKKTKKTVSVYYGRNSGNPLYVYRKGTVLLITSQNVTGKGNMLQVNKLYCVSPNGGKRKAHALTVPTYQYTYTPTTYIPDTYTPSVQVQHITQEREVVFTPEKENVYALESELQEVEEYMEIAKDILRTNPHDVELVEELKEYRQRRDELEKLIMACV